METDDVGNSVAVSGDQSAKKRSNKGASRSRRPAKALKRTLGSFASDSADKNPVKNNVKKGKRKARNSKKANKNSKDVAKKPKKRAKAKRKRKLDLRGAGSVADKAVNGLKGPRKSHGGESKSHFAERHAESFNESESDYNAWCAEQHTQTSIKNVEVDVIRWEHFALLIEEYYLQKDVSWK